MKDFFIEKFEYNLWANQKILEAFKYNCSQNESILKLFSHIINAEKIWLNRVLSKENTIQVWHIYHLEEFYDEVLDASKAWIDFLDANLTKEKLITYSNSKGIRFQQNVNEVIFHVLNHSNYHRAQINQILVKNKNAAAAIDYIFFKRT